MFTTAVQCLDSTMLQFSPTPSSSRTIMGRVLPLHFRNDVMGTSSMSGTTSSILLGGMSRPQHIGRRASQRCRAGDVSLPKPVPEVNSARTEEDSHFAPTYSNSAPLLNPTRQGRYEYSEDASADGADELSVANARGPQGVEFDPFQSTGGVFDAKLFRAQTEELKQEILSGDFQVKPTPYTPVEGTDATQFYVICVLLFAAFWLANYWAPDFIFKNLIFRSRNAEDDDDKDSL